jgi:hypothetical protein
LTWSDPVTTPWARDADRFMLISVHLPKTAGSSFGTSLEEHFGDRLYRDYRDIPLNTPPFRRRALAALSNALIIGRRVREADCIHGHFLPIKYQLMQVTRTVRFVTWLRDPVERLASHYHFWRRSYDPKTSLTLHRRVVEEDWSFDRFFRSPEMRNVYAQFLWGFPLSSFEFIGITEHYDEDFLFFTGAFLGTALSPHRQLANSDRTESFYVSDLHLRAEIEKVHHHDMVLYRRALELRRIRTSPSHR